MLLLRRNTGSLSPRRSHHAVERVDLAVEVLGQTLDYRAKEPLASRVETEEGRLLNDQQAGGVAAGSSNAICSSLVTSSCLAMWRGCQLAQYIDELIGLLRRTDDEVRRDVGKCQLQERPEEETKNSEKVCWQTDIARTQLSFL